MEEKVGLVQWAIGDEESFLLWTMEEREGLVLWAIGDEESFCYGPWTMDYGLSSMVY